MTLNNSLHPSLSSCEDNSTPSYENVAALLAQLNREPPEVALFPNVVGYAATADILRLYYSHSGLKNSGRLGPSSKRATSVFDLRKPHQRLDQQQQQAKHQPLYSNVR